MMGLLGSAAGNIGACIEIYQRDQKRKMSIDEENEVYSRLMRTNELIHEVATMLEEES
jgi:predicted ATPase